MINVRGHLEYCGVFSTEGDTQYSGDIMMHVGDIMSTVGGKSLVI